MPQLFYIDEKWSEQFWFSTGGTRAKKYLLAPNRKYYYFKRSQYKPASENKTGKDFKYEFWSEVIAYEIGILLGFDILKYDIAIDGEIMGCISESMIDSEKEELVEGVKYLQAFDNTYNPEDKTHQKRYTFQIIEDALDEFEDGKSKDKIVEMIVFDALIGNGDRHQENWAIINEFTLFSKALNEVEQEVKRKGFNKLSRISKFFMKHIIDRTKNKFNQIGEAAKLTVYRPKKFAPIYDSGSSLGRELLNERVEEFVRSKEALEKYIQNGFSEIHWKGQKLNHFELIRQLMDSSYNEIVKSVINRVNERFDEQKITNIVLTIDQTVPESHAHYRIPELRKQLIIKMVTLRFEKLRELINEGI